MRVDGISRYGRVTSGVKLMNLDDNVTVANVAKVREDKSLISENLPEESNEDLPQ